MNNGSSRIITLGGLGGSIGVILVWTLSDVFDIQVPAEIGMAVQTVIVFLLQHFTPPKDLDGDGTPDI